MEKREEAKRDYLSGMKYKDIADKYGVSINTVKSWKQRDGWSRDGTKTGAHKTEKGAHKKEVPKAVVELVESDELNERQKTFCLLYLKYKFNQTKAYREAYRCDYDTARTNASRMLTNANISKQIKSLKLELRNNSFIDIQDIIAEYEAQFSADITDYVTFGKRKVECMGPFGPIKDEDGNVIMKEVNYVDFNESDQVDGTLIKAVRMGKDGPVVELYDKQRALIELQKLIGESGGGGKSIVINSPWGVPYGPKPD